MLEGSSSLIEPFNFNYLIYYYCKITLIPKRIVEFTKCFKSYKNFKRAIMSFRSKIIKKMNFNNSSSTELKYYEQASNSSSSSNNTTHSSSSSNTISICRVELEYHHTRVRLNSITIIIAASEAAKEAV